MQCIVISCGWRGAHSVDGLSLAFVIAHSLEIKISFGRCYCVSDVKLNLAKIILMAVFVT